MPDATPAIDWMQVGAAIIAMAGETGVLIDYRDTMDDNMRWFVGDGDFEVCGPTLADAIAKFVQLAERMQQAEA